MTLSETVDARNTNRLMIGIVSIHIRQHCFQSKLSTGMVLWKWPRFYIINKPMATNQSISQIVFSCSHNLFERKFYLHRWPSPSVKICIALKIQFGQWVNSNSTSKSGKVNIIFSLGSLILKYLIEFIQRFCIEAYLLFCQMFLRTFGINVHKDF